MSQGELHLIAPRLGPDFAKRVLERADVVVARRRQIRRMIAGSAAASVVAVAVVSGADVFLTGRTPAPRREPVYVAASDLEFPTARRDDQANALSYLFPDAAPLARFAVQYSDASDGAGTDEDVLADENRGLR
jgi:hypothetical protein